MVFEETSALLRCPEVNGDGGEPDHEPSPAPPKWAFVVKFEYEVELASPRRLNSTSVTSAPYGMVRYPAVPLPVPEKVWL